jgi:hypothetical protein
MHKYTIFGLSLVALLFLATTTGKSMQVSASEERYIVDDYTLDYPSVDEDLSYGEDSYSYYDSYGDRYIVDDFNSDYPSVDEDLSYEEDSYSYGDSYGHKYDKYDKEPKEKKFLCKYGPLTGVFVKDKKFCDKKTPPTPEEDAELQCEECIKYWGHTLEQGQFRQFINYFSEWINAINFDFQPVLSSPNNPPQTPCAERLGNNTLVEGDNPNPNVECLPLAFNDLERNLSQVFEICEQLELALEYIASENNISLGLDKRHFSATAFGVMTIDSNYILALSEFVQYMYITDDDLPNPYDTFSSHLEELFLILSQQDDKEYHQYDKGYQQYDRKEKLTGIMVALYFDPPWDLLIELKNQYPNVPVIAVINPANGPGDTLDVEIAAEVLQLQAAGIKVIGYTFTNFGQRDTAEIFQDIDKYRTLYNVDGIFFDEVASSGQEEYLETLDDYANAQGALFTVGNPGTNIPPSYIGILDNYIIYEGKGLPDLNLIEERTISAFELFQNGFTAFLGGPACNRSGAEEECDTGIGLLECLEERLLPILEKENQPTMITESGQQDLVQALHQNSMTESLLQQLTPQQQGQSSISQEQMHPQQIVKSQPIQAESTQQQSTQPKGPSSISQEEMHPQQIVKLKQLLESSLPTSPFIYGVPKH